MVNIDNLVNEWAYRCKKGYPDMDSPSDLRLLKVILKEQGITIPQFQESLVEAEKDDISTKPINSPKIKKKEKKEYNVNPDNDVPRQKWTDVKKKLKGRDSSQRSEERNYRNEYDNYHKKPVQRERNAARLRARRLMDRWGKVKRFDNKDIHHKDNNPLNNEEDNLAVTTQKWNRTEPRLRLTKFIKGK